MIKSQLKTKGFTLIEALVALVILHIGIASLYLIFGVTKKAYINKKIKNDIMLEIVNSANRIKLMNSQENDSIWEFKKGNCLIEINLIVNQEIDYNSEDLQIEYQEKRAPELIIKASSQDENCNFKENYSFVLDPPIIEDSNE